MKPPHATSQGGPSRSRGFWNYSTRVLHWYLVHRRLSFSAIITRGQNKVYPYWGADRLRRNGSFDKPTRHQHDLDPLVLETRSLGMPARLHQFGGHMHLFISGSQGCHSSYAGKCSRAAEYIYQQEDAQQSGRGSYTVLRLAETARWLLTDPRTTGRHCPRLFPRRLVSFKKCLIPTDNGKHSSTRTRSLNQ